MKPLKRADFFTVLQHCVYPPTIQLDCGGGWTERRYFTVYLIARNDADYRVLERLSELKGRFGFYFRSFVLEDGNAQKYHQTAEEILAFEQRAHRARDKYKRWFNQFYRGYPGAK